MRDRAESGKQGETAWRAQDPEVQDDDALLTPPSAPRSFYGRQAISSRDRQKYGSRG